MFKGFIRSSLFEHSRLEKAFVGLYVLTIIIWPFRHARFFYPLLPFLVYYMAAGLSPWLDGAARKPARFACAALIAVVIAGQGAVWNLNKGIWHLRTGGLKPGWKQFYDANKWLGKNSRPDTVAASRKPETTFQQSGIKSIIIPHSDDPQKLLLMIESRKIDYIIVDAMKWRSNDRIEAVNKAIEKHPERFQLIYRRGRPYQTSVYRVARGRLRGK